MTNEEKELDEILQLYFPDDYYEEQRAAIIPYLLRWKKKRKPSNKKQIQDNCNCVFELNNKKGIFMCAKCGLTAGQYLYSEIQKNKKRKNEK